MNKNIKQMGIAGINETLKDAISKTVKILNNFRDVNSKIEQYGFYEQLPISNLSGKKMAIDLSILLHAKMAIANEQVMGVVSNIIDPNVREKIRKAFVREILSFFGQLIESGITPVIILDGETHPSKSDTVKARVEDLKNKIAEFERLKLMYINTSPFNRTEHQINDLKSAAKNATNITREDRSSIKQVLIDLGFKTFRAKHDAEALCAHLSIEGTVDAVFGTDTDNYALGTRLLVKKIYYISGKGLVYDCVALDEILYCLTVYMEWIDNYGQFINFTQSNLVDLCIIHGCDFNTRMVQPTKKTGGTKSVGRVGAVNLIKQYREFHLFDPYLYQYMGALNIDICRDRFKYEPSMINSEDTNLDWQLYSNNYRGIIDQYELPVFKKILFSKADPKILHISKNNISIVQYSTASNNSNIQIHPFNNLNNKKEEMKYMSQDQILKTLDKIEAQSLYL